MNTYVLGQVVFLQAYLTDPNTGDPTDPTTQSPLDDPTLSMTVYAPDGTSTTPSVTHAGLGVYSATVAATQEGMWLVTTNATQRATGSSKGRFFVSAAP